jgi:hypothetical protein
MDLTDALTTGGNIGIIVFALTLLGYIVERIYDAYRLGNRTYIPKAKSFDNFLHYSSLGFLFVNSLLLMVIILIPSLPLLKGQSWFQLWFQWWFIEFQKITNFSLGQILNYYLSESAPVILFLIFFEILLIFSMTLGKYAQKHEMSELVIETTDGRLPMKVSVVYDENEDFIYFLDRNGNWGLIRKSLVYRIGSNIP